MKVDIKTIKVDQELTRKKLSILTLVVIDLDDFMDLIK